MLVAFGARYGEEHNNRNTSVAQRLRALREAMGHDVASRRATAFCIRFGLDYKTWKNYENGFNVPIDAGLLISQKTGIAIEWIYQGVAYRVPLDVQERLGILPPTIPPTKGRSR